MADSKLKMLRFPGRITGFRWDCDPIAISGDNGIKIGMQATPAVMTVTVSGDIDVMDKSLDATGATDYEFIAINQDYLESGGTEALENNMKHPLEAGAYWFHRAMKAERDLKETQAS